MSTYADRIALQYPVRCKPKEKEVFRLYLMGALRELGYTPTLQSREPLLQIGGRITNVVVGDPETAKLVFIARYDTPRRSLLPPLIMPTRPLTALLYMALSPALALVGSFVAAFALTFTVRAPQATLPLFLVLLFAVLLYLRFAPTETRTLNDNTSGVAALLETAAALTPRYRGEVAFAFLDGGFGDLSGAKALRKKYPATREKTVVNVNCVAEGKELLILPSRYSRWDGEALDAVLDSFENGKHTTVFLKTDGLTYYPSDNRAFRHAFAICSCDDVNGFGRLIRPLHARAIDEEHLTILKNGLHRLAERYPNRH